LHHEQEGGSLLRLNPVPEFVFDEIDLTLGADQAVFDIDILGNGLHHEFHLYTTGDTTN
jgi:hypothetical protein